MNLIQKEKDHRVIQFKIRESLLPIEMCKKTPNNNRFLSIQV